MTIVSIRKTGWGPASCLGLMLSVCSQGPTALFLIVRNFKNEAHNQRGFEVNRLSWLDDNRLRIFFHERHIVVANGALTRQSSQAIVGAAGDRRVFVFDIPGWSSHTNLEVIH